MKHTVLIESGEGFNSRKLAMVAQSDSGEDIPELQLQVMQHDDEAFIDLSIQEVKMLKEKLAGHLARWGEKDTPPGMKKIATTLMDAGMEFQYENMNSDGERIMCGEIGIELKSHDEKLYYDCCGVHTELDESEKSYAYIKELIEQECVKAWE